METIPFSSYGRSLEGFFNEFCRSLILYFVCWSKTLLLVLHFRGNMVITHLFMTNYPMMKKCVYRLATHKATKYKKKNMFGIRSVMRTIYLLVVIGKTFCHVQAQMIFSQCILLIIEI